ncbi:MAG: hypothetical protein L0099_03945 [Acidobacteria bacterium]|nr:hypothetical protein [Acidobacteriota bacterium]
MRVPSFLIAVVLVAAPALAASAGTATGKLTLNDDTAEIRYAVAVPWVNKDDGRQGVKVVLSDVAIAEDGVARDEDGFDGGDKPGTVRAVEYVIYPEDGPDAGTMYHPGFKDYTLQKAGGVEFTAEGSDAGTVAGRLYMAEPDDFFGKVYFFDITFRAPISKASDAASGPPAGTAQGAWTVNDNPSPLRFAYAVARRNFEDEPEKFYVVLSEKEIAAEKLVESFGLQELMREGSFRALEFEIDPKKGVEGSQLYHDAFEHGSFSASGSSHKWVPRVFDNKTIAGRFYMTKLSDFFDRTYHYSVAFRADIQRKPPPTFLGAVAAASGPGQAVGAFIRAARLKNVVALKKVITAEMAADLDGPQGADILKMLPVMFEPGTKVVAVYQTGDTAEVVAMVKEKSGKSSNRLKTRLIDGVWKVSRD